MTPPDYLNLSPEEFELTVFGFLKDVGSKLDKFEIVHNSIETSHDGTYQIDIKANFEALGTQIKVLIECNSELKPDFSKSSITFFSNSGFIHLFHLSLSAVC